MSVQEELVFSGVLSRSAKEDVIKCKGKVGGWPCSVHQVT